MGANQNEKIDFSDFAGKPGINISVPPVLNQTGQKNKIQVVVITVCLLLAAIFWGYYFFQIRAGNNNMINNHGASEPFIPE